MKLSLWNIGLKVEDLNQEIDLLVSLGARKILREKFMGPDDESEFALLEFGGTRLFLTPKTVFEDKLKAQLSTGLTHAVFETDDLDRDFDQFVKKGCEVLIPQTEITAGFGSRRIAFFRSPGGFVFEILQILESKI